MDLNLDEMVYLERMIKEEISYFEGFSGGTKTVSYEICKSILNKISEKYMEVRRIWNVVMK